jgi:MraZ protein
VFLGSDVINMDAKGRFSVPTRIREELISECAGRLVITAHPKERCLLVYPEPRWQTLLNEIQSLPNLSEGAVRLQRLLIGYACPLEMDGNGRLLLSPTLRNYASLEKKLMLVGQGQKLELWSEEGWNQWLQNSQPQGEGAMTVEMASVSI